MFGLFDWIWEIFYGISKSMYAIIDNLLACANMLCGIQPIRYQGNEMDFVGFLLRNQHITYAFVGAVFVAITLIVIFTLIAIIRSISSEKMEKTPAQIAIKVAKTLLTFLFIPAAMALLIFFTNSIMRVLYSATLGGSPDGLGRFLAGAFAPDDALKSGTPKDFYLLSDFNYSSTSNMKKYVDLSDYDYFFSYLSCIVIIIALGQALLMFVDRAISLVVLFIFSPISLSTTILDDGARFKLWRDQFITKFLTGYGCIIAINIYALIIAAITDSALVFFDNSILNGFMKVVIVVGGGVSMSRMMALVGNLINAGAGSNELRDNAIATAGFKGAMMGAIRAPFAATRGAINFVRDSANNGTGTTIGRALGLRTSRDYQRERHQLGLTGNKQSSGAANNRTSSTTSNNGSVKNAIVGDGSKNNNANKGGASFIGGGSGNQNNNKAQNSGQGQKMIENAINNSSDNKKEGK